MTTTVTTRCGVIAAILCCAASVQAADSNASTGLTINGSLGFDLYAWPAGAGVEGRLWLDRGPWMANAQVRLGALRAQHDAQLGKNIAAAFGAYGVQAGAALQRRGLKPFFLLGYERVGSLPSDSEGGGGRTEQNVNLEIGARATVPTGEILVGVRAFFPFDRSITVSGDPPGPPLPRAALTAAIWF